MSIPLNIDELVDAEAGLVSPEVFHDQDLFAIEARKVFMRAWLFVGHDSMIPKPGDFIATHLGLNPVLLVRQRAGGVQVFLNACRHRGMKVCRADAGNARAFTCVFHGWSYGLDGQLSTVPLLDEAYGGKLDKSQFGLVAVPRVEHYKGLIFASFDPDAPPLLEYLGDMAWYLDAVIDRREGGIEVLGGVHKIQHMGNWKMGAEQFAGDQYHTGSTHVSARMSWREDELSLRGADPDAAIAEVFKPGYQFSTPAGHAVAGWRGDFEDVPGIPSRDFSLMQNYYEDTAQEVADRLGAERVNGPSLSAGLVFPNFAFLTRVFGQNSFGLFHPRTPNTFEYWRYCVVDKAAPAEVKAAMLRNMHVWPLGVADADDGENWSEIGNNLHAPAVRDTPLNYQMGAGDAIENHPVYPGAVTERFVAEEAQRNFFRRWQDFMSSEQYPSVRPHTATHQRKVEVR
ncbi:MAG: Rieske 2Fe-2S domain-containing protein [Actinobacteria bacterium]|nr:Rieske 2Fe-2S domain-containing protein [Actinomycetota bacterium]